MATKRAVARLTAAIKKQRAAAKARARAATDRVVKTLQDNIDMVTRFRFEPSLSKGVDAGAGPGKPILVAIDVDEERAHEAISYKWNDTQKIHTREDGTVRVTFTCDDFAPVIAWVLRFGSHAKVIKPAPLKKMVIKQLDEMFHSYAEGYESAPRSRRR